MKRHPPEVPNVSGWFCPRCGGTNLRVAVEATATLEQDFENDDHAVEIDVWSGTVWDGKSNMLCDDCGHRGQSGDFRYDCT